MFGSRNFLFARSSAALGAGGKLFSWGYNNFGTLGQNNTTNRSSPVQVGALTTWAQIGVGDYQAAQVLKNDKKLWMWGRNVEGQLGLGDVVNRSSPVQVGALNWAKPTVGSTQGIGSCAAVRDDETLWTWGVNAEGQLGQNNTISRSSPVQIGSDTNWALVSTGSSFMMAIKTTGSMWAWGKNTTFGNLGLGDTVNRSSPVQVGALTTWKQVNCSSSSAFAVKTDGTMWSWGRDYAGNLGQNNTVNHSSPVQIGALTNWSSVSAGYFSCRAIKTDGTLWTWGRNQIGQLGLENTTFYSSPKQVGSLTNWSKVVSTAATCFSIKTDGTLWAWGFNNNGQLGIGDVVERSSPVQVGASTKWIDVGIFFNTSGMAIEGVETSAPVSLTVPVVTGTAAEGSTLSSTTGTWSQFPSSFAFQWQRGTSNIGGATSSTYLVDAADVGSTLRCVVTATNAIGAASANSANTATVTVFGGKLFMWGDNDQGGLGQNNTVDRSSPVQVGALTTWSKLSAGIATMAVNNTGQLWSWGYNTIGQLGLGDTDNRSSPVQIGSLTDWATPSSNGVGISLCIKTNNTLWSWGRNADGQLGLGNTTNYSSPIQVGALTNWGIVSAGQNGVLCVKTDGTLWAWGKNPSGILGLGDTVNRSSPTQVGALTNWKNPSTSYNSSSCSKTDGTVWAWGNNSFGQLGQNDTVNRSSPIQVGSLTDWAINSGYAGVICTKTDGTLWSWGRNTEGGLGQNNTVSRSSPVQIGALTDWASPSANQSTLCLKTDGTLWAWGYNSQGRLGLGNAANRSSPVQVGSLTTWTRLSTPAAVGANATGCLQT